jgi:REP element-mobilizing transposase RayT
VTFRLADSLPAERLRQWREELSVLPKDKEAVEYRRRIEEYLDRGEGSAWLQEPRIAQIVQDALLYFDGDRYRLHAWTVMPNHVHTLFTPAGAFSLSGIVHSWKSFTAKEANRNLNRQGHFWQGEYFDTFIRDQRHLSGTFEYIENNPVKAGLCARPEDWLFGSARARAQGLIEDEEL